jgi:hypothetical protein
MRRLKLASAVVLLIAVSGVLSVGQPDPGRESGATAVAPGVTVEALRAPAGPWQIRVIRIDRATSPARLLTALGRGELRGRERLSGIIDRESARAQVIAGVNADFFRMSGPYAGGGERAVRARRGACDNPARAAGLLRHPRTAGRAWRPREPPARSPWVSGRGRWTARTCPTRAARARCSCTRPSAAGSSPRAASRRGWRAARCAPPGSGPPASSR